MLTSDGPFIIEFNARLGDPETQLILPRLEHDLLDVVEATLDGTLPALDLRWSSDCTVGVVLTPDGYPGAHETGKRIEGLAEAEQDAAVFHAGTALVEGGGFATSGSRTMTSRRAAARRWAKARARAYAAASHGDVRGQDTTARTSHRSRRGEGLEVRVRVIAKRNTSASSGNAMQTPKLPCLPGTMR